MADDRLADVLRICREALPRDGADRATYLDTACAADAVLRGEVEALLAHEASGEGFLDTPPWAPVTPTTLRAGQRLGPYEVREQAGAGGLGAVYKARDTRLGRTVAVKVIAGVGAMDRAARDRFAREARAVAALNHPHICTLYDVGREGEIDFLVMEYLDGQTLAELLARKGRLSVEQTLDYGIQIADALAAAHRQGIVHRDLKPGNVMLTKAGAKLLDFGLARLSEPVHGIADTAPVSAPGTVFGTVPYMAPEQVQGRAVDARTDLWALGALIYEMLTGKRAFEGGNSASVSAAILEHEPPPLALLAPRTPPILDHVVRRCLAKEPDGRWQTAVDVANELRWIREASGVGTTLGVQPVRQRHLRTALVVACVAGLAAAAGAGLTWWLRPPSPQPLPVSSLLDVRPADELNAGGFGPSDLIPTPGGSRTALTWAPDGRTLVFVGRRGSVQQLYVRRLDTAEARPLPNTEGAQVPAVSPDGKWVAFWAGGALKKVPLTGGPAMDVVAGIQMPPAGLAWDARAGLVLGGSMQPGDASVLMKGGCIWAVPAEGGTPKALTTVGEGELKHTLPSLLPGGRVLLYTMRKRVRTWGDEEVIAQRLPSGDRIPLLTDAADARYVPATGHLVFLRRGVLYAVAFDAERLKIQGPPVAMFDGVAQALTAGHSANLTGAGQFAIAATGTLAWVPGPPAPLEESALVTVDRRGHVARLPAEVKNYAGIVRVSPDGRRLAVTVPSLTEVGLWLYDLNRATLSPLLMDGEVVYFTWTPDGRHLVFDWISGGRRAIAAQPADGTAPPHVLLPGPGVFNPSSWTRDGRTLAAIGGGDVQLITLDDGKASVRPLWQTPHSEEWPAFSPDGRWLAYASNKSGRFEVYVQPYPGPGPEERVSIEGGRDPAWDPAGRELFFVSLAHAADKTRMMAADFAPGLPPRMGRPRSLFEVDGRDLGTCKPVRCYDVAPDGQRFYAFQARNSPRAPVVTQINLIQNWLK